MIDLHFSPTMNGQKIAIMLEETGLDYTLIPYNLMAGEHLTPAFHALSPNHKVPVIVDHDPRDGGPPLPIFESGAILLYLAEKTGQFMPTDFRRREAARQWLTWQVAGLGPMLGQASYFLRYAPPGQDYAVERYSRESRRLIAVLQSRLSRTEYLAEEYSIADIACWPYVVVCAGIGIELEAFPDVHRWTRAIGARPAVMRVVTGERTATPAALMQASMKLSDDQWSNVFGERMWGAAAAGAAA